MSKGTDAGAGMASSLIVFLHMMYNKKTALRVLDELIKQLKIRRREFE